MIAVKTSVPDLIEWLDMDRLHVHAPTDVMLVCGGETKVDSPKVLSLRDAFLRIRLNPPLSKIETRLAEDADIYQRDSAYSNWMDFEHDLAQVCQLVALFCESEGAYAELGNFAGVDEIARKLVILIDNINSEEPSFINRGPIDAVRQKYGKERLFVIHLADVGIESLADIAKIDLENLKSLLSDYIVLAMDKNKEPRSFDKGRNGHRIKLVTGLSQHFGALTLEELDVILYALGLSVSELDIRKYVDIGKFLDWLKVEPRGAREFVVPLQERDAIEYALQAGAPKINKAAWRLQVREHWSLKDPERFSALSANMLRAAR